jgi:hypothetical protein
LRLAQTVAPSMRCRRPAQSGITLNMLKAVSTRRGDKIAELARSIC